MAVLEVSVKMPQSQWNVATRFHRPNNFPISAQRLNPHALEVLSEKLLPKMSLMDHLNNFDDLNRKTNAI